MANITITVKVAEKGARVLVGGKIERSTAGHMWYDLSDGNGNVTSHGFAPAAHGWPYGLGTVLDRDSANYKDVAYARTFTITQSQYDAILNFSNKVKDSNRNYNVVDNSCVDFVWKSLEVGGLNPTGFQGDLLPSANIDDIKNLNIPLANQELAKEAQRGDPRTLKLSVNRFFHSDAFFGKVVAKNRRILSAKSLKVG